MFVNILLEYIG